MAHKSAKALMAQRAQKYMYKGKNNKSNREYVNIRESITYTQDP